MPKRQFDSAPAFAKASAGRHPKPNILIFMTDHQRGDTVLPEHPAVTPNLTKFAGEGVIFENVFCPSPHCCPSRATFQTGLYPSRHGVWNNVCNAQALSRGLRDGVRLWSEDLAEAGYELAWSGKWHVSTIETPADRGWRELMVTSYKQYEHHSGWDNYRRIEQLTLAQICDSSINDCRGIENQWSGTFSLFGKFNIGNYKTHIVLGPYHDTDDKIAYTYPHHPFDCPDCRWAQAHLIYIIYHIQNRCQCPAYEYSH